MLKQRRAIFEHANKNYFKINKSIQNNLNEFKINDERIGSIDKIVTRMTKSDQKKYMKSLILADNEKYK